MAPTKPLALQHRESVLKHLKLGEGEVAVVTGETAARSDVWSNPRVRFVTATPQAVWNDYRRGLVRLEEFALLYSMNATGLGAGMRILGLRKNILEDVPIH
jgi:ERCC4-related helicase